jgi:hypothetical protein
MTIVQKPLSQMSDTTLLGVFNRLDEKGYTTLIANEDVPFDGTLDFNVNSYNSHIQTADITFNAINVIRSYTLYQLIINVNSTFKLNFSEDYLMYRNDIDESGIYHI